MEPEIITSEGVNITLRGFILNIRVIPLHREPGMGFSVPVGGPFCGQLIGLHLHLLMIGIMIDLYRERHDE